MCKGAVLPTFSLIFSLPLSFKQTMNKMLNDECSSLIFKLWASNASGAAKKSDGITVNNFNQLYLANLQLYKRNYKTTHLERGRSCRYLLLICKIEQSQSHCNEISHEDSKGQNMETKLTL
ncbi:hypothetical protein O6H91_14G060000 [Diphasiastrum complanatum]|uniref:Uncharacterized protein n=1 Tax=Diphasiastrum complanatum TaxID=34168 RepID=A0ACC2BQ28_DIPCM|nr:hypothetical protein O6H91_14G060000 [Diphasiastrum complanatum]